jgi:hypothetical protein
MPVLEQTRPRTITKRRPRGPVAFIVRMPDPQADCHCASRAIAPSVVSTRDNHSLR